MEKSLIELATELMNKKKKPQNIYKFLKELAEISGLDSNDSKIMSKMYTDITTSSVFVYCGDDEETKEKDRWDLKHNHPLSLFDKEGSYFNSAEDKARAKEELKANKAKIEADKETAKNESTTSKSDRKEKDSAAVELEDEEKVNLNDYYDDDYEESYSEEEYEDMMDDYENMMD